MTEPSTVEDLRTRTAALLPALLTDLEALIALPSIAFPGFEAAPVQAAAESVVAMFASRGVAAELLPIPDGYPAVWAEIPGPPGAPTVLLYAHYDVQPAPPEQGWTTEPFTPTWRDGRLFGRGAADDKGGIAIHAGALELFDGTPPVTIKICIEGEEETISHLEAFVEANPERFQADVILVADMGSQTVGIPQLSTQLRGQVKCVVEVDTLDDPVHSGLYGGAAPDALATLVVLLSKLFNDDLSCAVPGLATGEWVGADYPAEMYRRDAGLHDDQPLIGGGGSVATKLWARPSVTVLGIDAPTVDGGGNVLQPTARALVAVRTAPEQDGEAALATLMQFLRDAAPAGVNVTVNRNKVSPGFRQATDGVGFTAMTEAMTEAFGVAPELVGSGGSIPLLNTLQQVAPQADFVLYGPQDKEFSHIHGPDESVHPDEIAGMIVAQALLLQKLGG